MLWNSSVNVALLPRNLYMNFFAFLQAMATVKSVVPKRVPAMPQKTEKLFL